MPMSKTPGAGAWVPADPSLPASDAIDQWTYEQLLKLRLKNGFHGAGQVTDCCIPTLEQAIQVCKDKILITPDKLTTWIDSVFKDIVVRNQAYQTLLIGYGTNTRLASRIQKQFNDAYGKAPMFMANVLGAGGGFAGLCDRERLKSTREVMEELNMDPVVRCGEFYNGTTITEYADVLADLRGKYRLYVEALFASDDVEENWETIKNAGACTLITNRAFDLCQYIAASYNG